VDGAVAVKDAPVTPLSFGPFHFDHAARRLSKSSEAVHLTSKAIDLLTLLSARRPDAVAKKEIHRQLWPDTFVSDVSLTTLIFELRSALGESARKPRFIRTVHGFGYAFQGDSGQNDAGAAETPFCIIHDGRDIGLLRGENILGRSRDCRVRIDSTRVSRHHARVTVDGDAALIEDCGSRNGTWVSGQRAAGRVRLSDGDEIAIAGIPMLFKVLSPGTGNEPTT
jgi:DNA-binding winged helix-turn-helix (wHTH) protein